MEAPSLLAKQVLQVMKEEAGFTPHVEQTLMQLCGDSKEKLARLIIRLELGLQEKLCDDRYVDWLGTREVEFVLWALDRNFRQPCDEFPTVNREDRSQRRRRSTLTGAMYVADMAQGSCEGDAEKHQAFQALHKFRHLMQTFFSAFKRGKRKKQTDDC